MPAPKRAKLNWPVVDSKCLSACLRLLPKRYIDEVRQNAEPMVSPARRLRRFYMEAGKIVADAIDRGALSGEPSLLVWRHEYPVAEAERYDHFLFQLFENWLIKKWPKLFSGSLRDYSANDFQSTCNLLADLIEGKVLPELVPGLVTVSEAAEYTNMLKSDISKLCNSGKIKSVGKGRDRRVDLKSAHEHIKKRR